MLIHKLIVFFDKFKRMPYVRRSAWVSKHAVISRDCVIGERVKIKCNLGEETRVGSNCFIADDVVIFGEVEIGNGTRVLSKSFIQTCSHDEGDLDIVNCKNERIKIGENVVVDSCCCIGKGVMIGDGAIVMMGSVVLNDVPSRSVVCGNPARVVGFRKNGVK